MARGDVFLKIETQTKGLVKGESHDEIHLEEIDVVSWSWGMRAHTDMSAGGKAPKADLDELDIRKRVDSASTALMAAVRNNEKIKTATLTVRKAGGTALEYFKIKIDDARITLLHLESTDELPLERLTIAFKKINVEYVPQGQDGRARAGMSFETEIS
jgi:type VI secretion system secreted protein Hcp